MDAIGNALRSERLRHGLTLEQIATQTKIGQYLLQAIEANQFDRLPGGLLTRSFLRQYAQVVGLDAEEVVASFKQQFEEPESGCNSTPPKTDIHSFPCCQHFFGLRPRYSSALVSTQYGRTCGAAYPRPTPRRSHNSRVISEADLRLTKSFQDLPELAPKERPAAVPYPSSRLGTEPGPSSAIHVVFTATEPVWISIQSDGNPVYTGMLEQQHNKELAASSRMTAVVGNAGGLEVSLNGKAIGPIGQHGEVRVVELTPAGAHITRPTE